MFTPANDDGARRMPPGLRTLLLNVLALGYPAEAAQAHLGNTSDGRIAWQVQGMLDDYADYREGVA